MSDQFKREPFSDLSIEAVTREFLKTAATVKRLLDGMAQDERVRNAARLEFFARMSDRDFDRMLDDSVPELERIKLFLTAKPQTKGNELN